MEELKGYEWKEKYTQLEKENRSLLRYNRCISFLAIVLAVLLTSKGNPALRPIRSDIYSYVRNVVEPVWFNQHLDGSLQQVSKEEALKQYQHLDADSTINQLQPNEAMYDCEDTRLRFVICQRLLSKCVVESQEGNGTL